MAFSGLTKEQKKIIEENYLRAKKRPAAATVTSGLLNINKLKCSAKKTCSDFSNCQSSIKCCDCIKEENVIFPFPTSQKCKFHFCGGGHHSLQSKVPKFTCTLISRERFEMDIGLYAYPVGEIFKSMSTRKYDPVKKRWSFKLEEYHKLMEALQCLAPGMVIEKLPRPVCQIFHAQLDGKYPSKDWPSIDLSHVNKKLVGSLMPHQYKGVSFGIHNKGRVLLADEMGLGKTIQAICLACYYIHEWPLLVVVPPSLLFDWEQQFCYWVPSLDNGKSINVVLNYKDSCTQGKVNILSYNLMIKKAAELKSKNFNIIIMDESHFLKNKKPARTRVAIPLLQKARRVILITGTPALSRPLELYTQIIAISPGLFEFKDFGFRYCDGKKSQYGWDFLGSSNMTELQLILEEKIMIRRLKEDILLQLPAKQRQVVLLFAQSSKIRKTMKMWSSLIVNKELKGRKRNKTMTNFFRDTGKAKTDEVRKYICDILEKDKKFLVFGYHSEVLNSIEDEVKNCNVGYIRIDGKTPFKQRKFLCDQFQTDADIKIAILSLMAANSGLNLTAAAQVIFAELFWNPGILIQAEDRVHRKGQKYPVHIIYLLAPGTADDYIWPIIQNKLQVLSKAGLIGNKFWNYCITKFKYNKRKLPSKPMTDNLDETICDEQQSSLRGTALNESTAGCLHSYEPQAASSSSDDDLTIDSSLLKDADWSNDEDLEDTDWDQELTAPKTKKLKYA